MPFAPDIIVTSKDSPRVLLAVEAKTNEREFRQLSGDIRTYLSRMSCPFGLIVFPKTVWLFRNTYSGLDEDAVEEMGPFRLQTPLWSSLLGHRLQHGEFEKRVQSWLEKIASEGMIKDAPIELEGAFENYVLPALTTGVIRAGGPRPPG